MQHCSYTDAEEKEMNQLYEKLHIFSKECKGHEINIAMV